MLQWTMANTSGVARFTAVETLNPKVMMEMSGINLFLHQNDSNIYMKYIKSHKISVIDDKHKEKH